MLNIKSNIRIAIIGAGWMGIGCLRVLAEHGYQVDVYEKNSDVGGVWHPSNNYANLKCHNPANSIAFHDFPLSDNIDKTGRLTSYQIFTYLKNYIKAKNIENHIKFLTTVNSLHYDSVKKTITLSALDSQKKLIEKEYDYVINTNVFSNKHIPHFANNHIFKGELIHSFDASAELLKQYIAENKRITVIGGSKTATDIILFFSSHSYKVNWLYREPYWFFKYPDKASEKKSGILSIIHKQLARFTNKIVTKYYRNEKIIYLLFRALGLLHTFGSKKSFDLRKFHLATIKTEEMRILARYNKLHGIQGEIVALEENGIRLTNNQFLKSDIIICCTGSGPNGSELNIVKDGEKFYLNSVKNVYRSRIIPCIPKLIFTGYYSFISGIVKTIVEGKWIHKYIEENLSVDHLENNQKTYDYAFFEKAPLFNSDRSLLVNYYSAIDQFLQSGEIDKEKFFQWTLDCYNAINTPHTPFEF